jgi:SAM-dependent methyltransferase
MLLDDYKHLIRNGILDAGTFVRATFRGRQRGQQVPWKKVVVRPVLIKGERCVQFSYFDEKRDITQNYAGAQVPQKLDELLLLPFTSIHLQTTGQDVQIQITKKGRAIVHRQKTPGQGKPSLEHDRRKALLFPADRPDPLLQMLGIMTGEGKVRASMRKKFRQINEFLKLVTETGALQKVERSPLHIVDCGCGKAYLTFATYHYLNHILGLPTELVGVDVNEELVRRQSAQSRALGWENLTFKAVKIVDFQPAVPPDVVFALHACDIATDEALAQAVKWQSGMIFGVPCCHHHLQRQLGQRAVPSQFRPVLRHGVLRNRLGDILTDTFRSLILRIMGYRTDVIEFVSTEHTDKNLMIRAIRSTRPGNPQAIREYKELEAFWHVTPYLERLLEKELAALGAVEGSGTG